MNPELWKQVRWRFQEVSQLPESERLRYLESLRRENPEVAELVSRIVVNFDPNDSFLETPLWAAAHKPAPARIFSCGELLADRFEVTSFVAAGGAGEVYRAFDRLRNINVALKAVLPTRFGDSQSITALRDELNVAMLVSHPNVCRLYDVVAPPGSPCFITMEFLAGETLAARLKRGRVPIPEANSIAAQIVAGLSEAHKLGVIHRDL